MFALSVPRLAAKCFQRGIHTSVCSPGSALYITGQKASETYAVLTPYIDCETKFQNISLLKENIKSRGLDIDVDKLKKSWDFLKTVKQTKYQLEARREETTKKIKILVPQKTEKSESEITTLKILGKLIRDNLKTISKEIWDLEETVMIRILSLPNDLHSDTPRDSELVISEEGVKPRSEPSLSHIEIANQQGLLKYSNPTCYYLESTAAEFEIAVMQFSADFLNQNNFIETSNCDFSKSIVIEGCGKNHTDSNSVFILQSSDPSVNEDSRLHLVGGASLLSFAALFTKHETNLGDKPLKLFTLGRSYSPCIENNLPSLFSISQESCIEFFIANSNCEKELMKSFNDIIENITELYKILNLHFRIVKCNAKQLKGWESLRCSVQMYSTHLQDYLEVGHVSVVGTYISKRLLMKYQRNGAEKDFLSLVTGRVLSVPRMLACLVEEQGALVLPSRLEQVL